MTLDRRIEHRVKRLSEGAYVATTPAGNLHLQMHREDIPLVEALDFAARNNAKRRFLFVSRLLGRHLPTPPSRLRSAAAALSSKLRATHLAEPCVFVGMSETATTLGQAVFRDWTGAGGHGVYVDTTRRRTGGEVAFRFSEAHSHASAHLVHLPLSGTASRKIFDNAETLVIIDDEMTTGSTAENLTAAYEHRRGCPIAAHVAVLVRWATLGGESGLQTHALLEGSFEFAPTAEFNPQPVALTSGVQNGFAPRGTRHGILAPQTSPWAAAPAGDVLVIGTGEFGFIPLLLAEQIERNRGHALLQCTTRSPVVLGGAIQHVRSFPALTGDDHIEFLYNVPDDHPYDRVILCCEDHLPPPWHPILSVPRIECRSMT